MTSEAMSATQLLLLNESRFDATIHDLSVKGLLETISVLQKEMTKEQENFNQLSGELGCLRKNSGQYKSVSREMTASQSRLTLLMNRSMKCFSQARSKPQGQQAAQQNKSASDSKHTAKDSQPDTQVQHPHSTKESAENAQSLKPVVKKPERQSTSSIPSHKRIAPQPLVLKPVNNSENKLVANTDVKPGTFQTNPLRPVSVPLNRTSIEVKTENSEPSEPSSFAEAKSRFSSSHVQNVNTSKSNGVVSFNTTRSQVGNVTKSKTVSNGAVKQHNTSIDLKRASNENDKNTVPSVNEVGVNIPKIVSNENRIDNSEKKNLVLDNATGNHTGVKPKTGPIAPPVTGVGVTSSSNLGPMANQKSKFISKSMGDVFSQNLSKIEEKPKPEVVKGFQSTKPKRMIVMSQDKQAIDLDSFVDRKKLMNEIKQFDKELNPVVKSDDIHEIKLNIAPKNSNTNVNKKQEQKPSILDEIKQFKKPSELKTKEHVPLLPKEKETSIKTDARMIQTDARMIQTKHNEYKTVEMSTNKKSAFESIPNNAIGQSSDKEVSQIQMFDNLLIEVDSDDENEETEITKLTDHSPKDTTLSHSRGTTPSAHSREATPSTTDESGDSQSDISDVDEARFVTEFQFTQIDQTPDAESALPTQEPVIEAKLKIPQTQTTKSDATTTSQVKVTTGNGVNVTGATAVAKEADDDDDKIQARLSFINWDPCKLLAELYQVKMMPDTAEDISHRFIGMEGLMEKLPMNKKKATLLKTWKRRFFLAKGGWLHYFETGNRDKPSDSLQLMGGKVEELGPRVLGVDDGRGKYLMVRIPTDREYGQWKIALESQTADNVKATYVRPAPASVANPFKKVVIVDIGSSGIRAGILGERPTLPHIFFPSVIATHKQTGEIVVGVDAYRPDIRKSSTISQPVRPTNKVDKERIRAFNIDMDVMPEIFKKVFKDLKVNPRDYWLMLSTPQNLGDKLKEGLMRIVVDQFGMRGACMVQQSLLALYSYNSISGIIVDLGERMEILPIYDGLLIEGGVSRQAYGGAKVHDSLYLSLLEHKYKFNTPVEKLLVRHICEQSCYVAPNYKEEKVKCDLDPESVRTNVSLEKYIVPEGAYQSVDVDISRFKSPEGFFNTDNWGMDYPNIHKLVFHGIQQSPMDARKHMYRSVYLSGGVTMLPGFAERLQLELKKLAPPSVIVEVHASPQRYHAAYIGACSVAGMDIFLQSCVTADEWRKLGIKACRKWGTS